MDQPTRVQKPKRRSKTPPVRHITISPDAAKAYEKLVKDRDDKQRDYGRHLSADNKPR
ncbi:MAG TPA: hypothetical protein VHA70_09865 [Bauldia sp.]|nr:hypothetical protein [Bauldia sp.]